MGERETYRPVVALHVPAWASSPGRVLPSQHIFWAEEEVDHRPRRTPGPRVSVPPLGLFESVDGSHFMLRHESHEAVRVSTFLVTGPLAYKPGCVALFDGSVHVASDYDDVPFVSGLSCGSREFLVEPFSFLGVLVTLLNRHVSRHYEEMTFSIRNAEGRDPWVDMMPGLDF